MLSSNDHNQWKEFGKKILEEKMNSSKQLIHTHRDNDDKTSAQKSTTMLGDEIADDNKDHIAKPCDEIKWNVVNENSNILILMMEIESNKSICSLSNANFASAYSHVCQYSKYKTLILFSIAKFSAGSVP